MASTWYSLPSPPPYPRLTRFQSLSSRERWCVRLAYCLGGTSWYVCCLILWWYGKYFKERLSCFDDAKVGEIPARDREWFFAVFHSPWRVINQRTLFPFLPLQNYGEKRAVIGNKKSCYSIPLMQRDRIADLINMLDVIMRRTLDRYCSSFWDIRDSYIASRTVWVFCFLCQANSCLWIV